ncbi:MAG: hypothetical protein V3V61_04545 [Gammaproteobacteria bacterium]
MSDLKEILLSRNVVIPENFQVFKNIFKHFKGKQVQDIDGDKRPLMDKAEEFYLTPPASGGFLQGDVLEGISPVWLANDENKDLTAFVSDPQMAMILSTECDCENRENAQAYIRFSPIITEEQLLNDSPAKKRDSIAGNLKANRYSEYFWMPGPFSESGNLVVDLSHVFSVTLTDLYDQLSAHSIKRKLSLSEDAYFLLLVKLAWFFLRPSAPDTQRSGLTPRKRT